MKNGFMNMNKSCHPRVFLSGIFRLFVGIFKRQNTTAENRRFPITFLGNDSLCYNSIKSIYGFTLIELLVVVLIIGILAAVALPQYQAAVIKSRFTQLQIWGDSIWKAEQLYYLETGTWTKDFRQLVIEAGTVSSDGQKVSSGDYACVFGGGDDNLLMCYYKDLYDEITPKYLRTVSGKDFVCRAYGADKNSIAYRVCKSLGRETSPCQSSAPYCQYWLNK